MFNRKTIIILLILCFSLGIRLINLNQVGRTVDELFCPEPGYHFLQLIGKGDFTNKYWIENSDPPPICRYIYGIFSSLDIKGYTAEGEPVFNYDLTHLRLLSALLGSLAVVFVALIGWEYASPFVGIISAIIFSLIPTYLGVTQLVTQESIFTLLYNMNIYFFLKFLGHQSGKKAFFLGILLGITILDKLTNSFLILILITIYVLWYKVKIKKQIYFDKKYLLIFAIGFTATTFVLWPILFLNFKGVYDYVHQARFADKYPPWEWFLGIPVQVPNTYYVIQFLVRTPVLLLVLFLAFIELRSRKINWIFLLILAWFSIPFLQSLYLFRQQGVRYIIQVYAPFSMGVAIGIEKIGSFFSKRLIFKYVLAILVIGYMAFSLNKFSPYYLDYFNELVKGVQGVYKHQLFEIGWWGQGGKDAGDYIISQAKAGNTVGYKLNPGFFIESSDKLQYEKFQKNKNYDFVVTNYAHYQKVDYNNDELKKDYEVIEKQYNLVHTVSVDGVPLYKVYKNKLN